MSQMQGSLTSRLPPLRAWGGTLTDELVRTPGRFGLGAVPGRLEPDSTTTVICGFCATGCALNVHLDKGEAVNLTADPEYPVNTGMACPKGWEALAPLSSPDRATTPFIRGEGGKLTPVDWHQAASIFVERFRAIKEKHGSDALAFLSTGQICTEEMALLGCLAKFGFGFAHGDGNTRQCMATAVTAYKESFGFDAPPYTYQDFEESDVIVLVGSNLCIAHPIMWQRVLQNKNNPEIIVVDPRKTETAMAATQHYGITPKSDLVLLYGLANLLLDRGAVDRGFICEHTEGFEAFARHVKGFTAERVIAETGLSAQQLEGFVATIARGKRVSFWWTMGVNQGHEAVRTAQAIINLALMTGNIGRPGTGANSITGQCNAMGSRLFSNTTGLVGGHDFSDVGHREKIAEALGIDISRIPDKNCLAYDQIITGIGEGRIKGLWVIATNSAHSWINQKRFQDVIGKLDFLVVQDMYHTTETAAHADLVLPAAGWGEKDGTFINSERRIGLVKKIARAPGQALADFSIFKLLSHYWGCGEMFARWGSPEEAFNILKKLTRNRPCDISGIGSYRMIDEAGGIQWPLPEGVPLRVSQRRLFEDHQFYRPGGRAKFVYANPLPQPEPTDKDYPFLLLTGRGTSAQWHTQTRTGKSGVLKKLYPRGNYVEVNPSDAGRLGVASGRLVEVSSRRGTIEVKAFVTPTVQPGQVFIPMHYADTNRLTFPAVDPHSRQPNYKACAVRMKTI